MSRHRNWERYLTFVVFCGVFSGCAYQRTAEDLFILQRYDDSIRKIMEDDGDEVGDVEDSDYVLHNMRLGSCELYSGNYRQADKHFGRATSIVDSSIGTGRGVVSVALWESSKYFKGETYERAALYYYRGLTNYLAGKADVARASFRNALLTDKQSKAEDKQEDNAGVFYMLAKSFLAEGDTQNARIAMSKAHTARPANEYLTMHHLEKDNLHVLIETGDGPMWLVGEYEHKFFSGRPGGAQAAEVYVDGVLAGTASLLVNWFHQGATEGATGKDTVQTAKSCIWQAADCVGCGCLASLCSVSTNADDRSWRFLPDAVWLFSARIAPGPHTITLRFPYHNKLTKEYGARDNKPVDIDRDQEGEPRLIVVGVRNGEIPAYEESHHHIGVPESDSVTLLFHNGLGKQSQKD